MSAQISLVRRDDFGLDQESLSLWNYANGFSLAADGWAVARPQPSDTRVSEALTLQARGTSPDNLAANVQALDALLQKVAWFNDPQERYGVWLRVQQPRETGARQALVTAAKRDPLPIWSHAAQDGAGGTATYGYGNFVAGHGLALERTPYWESSGSLIFDSMTSLSSVGGMGTIGGTGGTVVAGDLPARLGLVQFGSPIGGGGPMAQFWAGFRSARFGAPANFVPYWDLPKASILQSSGGAGGGTATVSADAAATGGTAVVCGFNDSVLARRVTIRALDVSASNWADQRGTFLVLLRAKLSAAPPAQVNVRLCDGLVSSVFATRDRVAVTGTSYALYELGAVKIPSPGRLFAGSSNFSNYSLALDAERAVGTPTLSVDCLIMIPLDEGWLATSIDSSSGALGVDVNSVLYVTDRADGTRDSTWVDTFSGALQSAGVPRGSGGLPLTAGSPVVLVVAAQRQTGPTTFVSNLADLVNVQVQVYERWESLRGAAA